MDIIEKLLDTDEWLRFLEYKESGGHLSPEEGEALRRFITSGQNLSAAAALVRSGAFCVPTLLKINKRFSEKKRSVFTFAQAENYLQKMLAFELLDYDCLFAENLYSFRKNSGVKKAAARLFFAKDMPRFYSFKLDISDYFGSVEPQRMLPLLQKALPCEERLLGILEAMLTQEEAVFEGERVKVKKGILAGSPLSGFMANLFLSELDFYFQNKGVLYARYSDDIIVFAENEEELAQYRLYIEHFLAQQGLRVNEKKVFTSAPGEKWDFLGFSYHNGTVDISDVAKAKLKKKMRRKMRALARWQRRKAVPPEKAALAFVRYFNRKLFDNPVAHELTWARWYFPIINTAESLKELDAYAQQCIRFLATGSYGNKKFRFAYADMKALGYVTLVNRYYSFKGNKS